MDSNQGYQYLFKVILVGDLGVGKSSLIQRFVNDDFTENSNSSTIGAEFRFKDIVVDEKVAKLQIWDTAGQERFQSLLVAYYRGANGVIIVFDKTNPSSLEKLSTFISQAKQYAEDSIKVIVGNKSDREDIRVDQNAGKKIAESNNLPYIETSALNGNNVKMAFEELTKAMISKSQPIQN